MRFSSGGRTLLCMNTFPYARRFGWALVVVAAGVCLVGCSPNDSGGSTAPASPTLSATAAACSDAAELRSSVQTLTEVEPLQDGLNELEAASDDTRAALEDTVASVTAELRPAVEQVATEFAAVQTALQGVTTENLRQQAPSIATALRGLETALSSLAETLSQECPEG